MAEDSKEYDRDSDKISHDEFKNLETQEQKKSIVGKIKTAFSKEDGSSEEDQKEEKKETRDSKLNDLTMKVERHDAKFEELKEFLNGLNDKLVDFSSQMGEMRSMFASREKFFEKIENQYEQVNDLIKQMDVNTIDKNFKQVQEKQSDFENQLGMFQEKNKLLENQINDFKTKMDKIGSFDNVLKTLEQMKEEMNRLAEMKTYVERLVSKSETYYTELSDAISILKKAEDRIGENEDSINKISNKLDKVENETKTKAKYSEVKSLSDDIKAIKKDIFKQHLKNMFSFLKSSNNRMEDIASGEDSISQDIASASNEKQEVPSNASSSTSSAEEVRANSTTAQAQQRVGDESQTMDKESAKQKMMAKLENVRSPAEVDSESQNPVDTEEKSMEITATEESIDTPPSDDGDSVTDSGTQSKSDAETDSTTQTADEYDSVTNSEPQPKADEETDSTTQAVYGSDSFKDRKESLMDKFLKKLHLKDFDDSSGAANKLTDSKYTKMEPRNNDVTIDKSEINEKKLQDEEEVVQKKTKYYNFQHIDTVNNEDEKINDNFQEHTKKTLGSKILEKINSFRTDSSYENLSDGENIETSPSSEDHSVTDSEPKPLIDREKDSTTLSTDESYSSSVSESEDSGNGSEKEKLSEVDSLISKIIGELAMDNDEKAKEYMKKAKNIYVNFEGNIIDKQRIYEELSELQKQITLVRTNRRNK